jgi:pilus assembly protein CpaE
MLSAMSGIYPYVVVDLPRTLDTITDVALSGADCVLIVVQLTVPSVRNACRLREALVHGGVPEDGIELVVNRCNSQHAKVKPNQVAEHFKKPVFGMVPNDYRRVMASLNLGTPIVNDAPRSSVRKAIQKMATAITEQREQQAPDQESIEALR